MAVKVFLDEKDIPRQWYNLAADLPMPLQPPLGPDGNPISPDMLAPVFPMNLVEQEVSQERWIDIPEPILDILYRWRPSPLHRAKYLEEALGTPARIYYKNEGVSPPGSHKPNTAVEGLLEPLALHQLECYEAAVLWARTEGFISAPETSHALAATIREAKQAKEEGKEKVILMNWSGHGLMDLTGYQAYFEGKLGDYPLPEEEMQKSLQSLENLPKPSTAKSGKW